MKKLILVLFVLLSSGLLKADSLDLMMTDAFYEIGDVYFANANRGYVCGNTGIYETWNGGLNWHQCFGNPNPFGAPTYGIYDFDFCADGLTAYAVGWKGTPINDSVWRFSQLILKSTTAGNGWREIYSLFLVDCSREAWKSKSHLSRVNDRSQPAEGILCAVACIDPQTVVVSGSDNASATVLRSSDGGQNWEEVSRGGDLISELQFRNTELYGCALEGIVGSTDRGLSWQTGMPSPPQYGMCLAFAGNKTLIGGLDQTAYYLACSQTSDNGAQWTTFSSLDSGYFTDMLFLDDQVGYATAKNPMWFGKWNSPKGYVLKTTDGGASWFKIFERAWSEMEALCRVGNYIYAAGVGRVIRILPDGLEPLPISFHLAQNFPNPFNPITRISFSIDIDAPVSLKVYDNVGREVAMLFSGFMVSGRHEIDFNGSGLGSGVYFYSLRAGAYSETKKMMLVK